MRGTATEADLSDHLIGPQQRHVLQEQANHALALALRGGGVAPESREVSDQSHHLLTLVRAEYAAFAGALTFVVFLRRGKCAQLVVPLRFERVRHQAVIRIDAEIAP